MHRLIFANESLQVKVNELLLGGQPSPLIYHLEMIEHHPSARAERAGSPARRMPSLRCHTKATMSPSRSLRAPAVHMDVGLHQIFSVFGLLAFCGTRFHVAGAPARSWLGCHRVRRRQMAGTWNTGGRVLKP